MTPGAAPSRDAAAARRFLERLWSLENGERPGFLIGDAGPRIKGGRPIRSALFSTEGRDTVRERLLDPDRLLAAQLEEIDAQARLGGDLVPALCPTLGVVAAPSAFGCEVVWQEGAFPAVRPLADDDPVAAAGRISPRTTDGELGRILATTRRFIEATGGRVPIRLTDLQGPLDNAALIAGHTAFLEALAIRPDEAHRLLRRVTSLMIAFVKVQRGLVRGLGAEFVPGAFQPWLPDGRGIAIANDVGVMLSAAQHDAFGVPYINALSEEFGGVYIHSCGAWAHLAPSLEKIKDLRGLEFGASEAPYGPVLERFGGRTVLSCRVGLNRDIRFAGMADFVTRILGAKKTTRGLFVHADVTNGLVGADWPETDLDEIRGLLEGGTT